MRNKHKNIRTMLLLGDNIGSFSNEIENWSSYKDKHV